MRPASSEVKRTPRSASAYRADLVVYASSAAIEPGFEFANRDQLAPASAHDPQLAGDVLAKKSGETPSASAASVTESAGYVRNEQMLAAGLDLVPSWCSSL